MGDKGAVKAKGLKWRTRAAGERVPYWIAPPDAVADDFPVRSVNLRGLSPESIVARCDRMNAEVELWRSNRLVRSQRFDGTFASLFDLYETHEQSSYHSVSRETRSIYNVYLVKLRAMIGALHIRNQSGVDVARWHKTWRQPDAPGGKEKIGAAGMALSVLKNAVTFGVTARLTGCSEFREILRLTHLPRPRPRHFAPTAADVEKVRAAAHEAGIDSLALAVAIQFDTSLRQWDVIGKWLELSHPTPSAVLGYGEKWAGISWSHVGDDMVLRYTPAKTARSSAAEVEIDLKLCPMVIEEIARIPQDERVGPIVKHAGTGLPWRKGTFLDAWRKVAKAAEFPAGMWNRDLRAGAVTEARKGGADISDAARMAGHSNTTTTARVYDRSVLDATRRAQIARNRYRGGEG